MIDIAHDHGGMLLKFGGDALLLFFDGDGHARRAAGAAVEMRRALRKAAEMPTSVGPLRLSMSVGIHSGDVHFFLVGASHRNFSYSGRLQRWSFRSRTPPNSGEILLSAASAAALPESATHRAPTECTCCAGAAHRCSGNVGHVAPADAALIASLFPKQLGDYLSSAPEPEHRVVCIAFARFSGTDAFLLQRGADELAKALQSTVGIVQACLDAEGVTLLAIDIDRDGGKFFLGSGVPFAHEDDEGVMLRALRRIADARLPLPLQIGVNRGHAFAAEVGAPDRAAYSAMGDTTNTAARITSKAPSGSIYAHPSVLDQSLTLFDVRAVGPFSFKGKKAPMLVYEVGAEIGPRRREGLQVDAFIGRAGELDLLRDAIDSVHEGRGAVLSVVGDSGHGQEPFAARSGRIATRRSGRVAARGTVRRERTVPTGARSSASVAGDSMLAITAMPPPRCSNALLETDAAQLPWLSLVGDALQIDIEPSPEVARCNPVFAQSVEAPRWSR